MKLLSLIVSLSFTLTNLVVANDIIVIEGFYQGKNLFVKNTTPEDGVGYSVYEVEVNGKITTDEVNSSAFEIDLSANGLKIGDSVMIKIKYKTGDRPIVLNPEVLLPPSTFDVVSMSVDQEGQLLWTTINELHKLNFIIEQYKWNKWVVVGHVEGVGMPDKNDYVFNLTPHSGKNIVRVKQLDCSGQPRLSPTTEFISKLEEVKINRIPGNHIIYFSTPTSFQIYDYDGVKRKVGFGQTIDISNLEKGAYYLYYDNHTTSFGKSGNNSNADTNVLVFPEK